MYKMRTQISIQAKPADVFRVLQDFKNYHRWNPWITIDGNAVEGEYIKIKQRQFTLLSSLRYLVDKVSRSEQLSWRGTNIFSFLLYTRREHLIYIKADDSTIYTTKFYFIGPLSTIVGFLYQRKVRKGLKVEAMGLKHYCEKHFKLGVI